MKYRVSLDFFSISNSKKNRFRNKLDFLLSSHLIFTACVACKNQVRTRKKIEFRNRFFFRVCNKLPNWHFKNQVQIDTVIVSWGKVKNRKDKMQHNKIEVTIAFILLRSEFCNRQQNFRRVYMISSFPDWNCVWYFSKRMIECDLLWNLFWSFLLF